MSERIKVDLADNGLLVATDYMKEVETVSLIVHVKSGSCNETIANNGMSHFLEHMAFKGTATRNALEIASDFDLIGGNFNAYTTRDRTVYYFRVLKKDFVTGIKIFADILQNSIFDVSEIAREKEVILQEIAQTNDTADDIIFDIYQGCAYKDQAFGRSILGTKETVQSFTRAQILDYVKSNYYAQNIIIAAAGNIEHVEFADSIYENFKQLAPSNIKYSENVNYTAGYTKVQRDLEQVHMVLGFRGVSCLHQDYYSEQVLALIAGGGMSSRLFQEIREKRGLAYSIAAYSSNYTQDGMFNIYSAVNENKANECIDIIISELMKLTHSLNDDEIIRAKSQIRANIFMGLESSLAKAEKLSGNLSVYGRYISNSEIMSKIDAINKSDLEQVALRLFKKDQSITVAAIGKVDKLYNYDNIKAKL